jgi:hypothetical protein
MTGFDSLADASRFMTAHAELTKGVTGLKTQAPPLLDRILVDANHQASWEIRHAAEIDALSKKTGAGTPYRRVTPEQFLQLAGGPRIEL